MQRRGWIIFALVAALLVILPIGWYLLASRTTEHVNITQKAPTKTTGPSSTSNDTNHGVWTAGPLHVTKVPDWNAQTVYLSGSAQITLKKTGEDTPSGLIIYAPTLSGSVSDIASRQIGSPSQYSQASPPKYGKITLHGKQGILVTVILDQTGEARVAAVSLDNKHSLIVVMNGPEGSVKELQARVKTFASGISIDE